MKAILTLVAACLLAGCASNPRQPSQHPLVGTMTEDGWQVVSVTPVGQEPQNVYHVSPPPPQVSFSLGVVLGRSWRHRGRRH